MAQSTLPLSFAPLEGITGWLFRRVHHSRFPGLARYYTPFSAPTADSPLTGRGLNDVLPEHNEGVPVVPQLLTNKADDFISAARRLQDLGYNEVNLNLGCPSGTVVSKKKGAGFLSDPQGIDAFLDTVFRRLDNRSFKPAFRLIVDADSVNDVDREFDGIAQLDLLRNLDLLEAADGVLANALVSTVVNHQVCSIQHACAVTEVEPAIHHVRNLMLIKPVRLFAFQIHTVRSFFAFLYPVPIEITGRFAFTEGPALRLVAGQRV